jgi:predicted LPLAT superfamily acyltransferase
MHILYVLLNKKLMGKRNRLKYVGNISHKITKNSHSAWLENIAKLYLRSKAKSRKASRRWELAMLSVILGNHRSSSKF